MRVLSSKISPNNPQSRQKSEASLLLQKINKISSTYLPFLLLRDPSLIPLKRPPVSSVLDGCSPQTEKKVFKDTRQHFSGSGSKQQRKSFQKKGIVTIFYREIERNCFFSPSRNWSMKEKPCFLLYFFTDFVAVEKVGVSFSGGREQLRKIGVERNGSIRREPGQN